MMVVSLSCDLWGLQLPQDIWNTARLQEIVSSTVWIITCYIYIPATTANSHDITIGFHVSEHPWRVLLFSQDCDLLIFIMIFGV